MKTFQVVLVLAIILGIFFYVGRNPENSELFDKINRLELKIDSLNLKKDSIRTIIDSTHIKIITNEKHYQERINTILVQSSSDDSSFIANYIRFHICKRDSLNIY